MEPVPGTSVIAVTVEPAGGSPQPTSDPIIVGTLTTAS
jgi:anti-sigma-K factor RskA